ncbi:hypothetical protein J2Z19_003526 [Ensifer adhaerens]|uniref:Uncharacterized protein n=1 Tax=Ensifer adhaerens TaxID=106592 RepID=A0ACC5SY54_ENSAD|nr:hypothetical protein [Ensifer adhaerens]MBP1873807.1 hypothetical protein [Ensifer adhaerens]
MRVVFFVVLAAVFAAIGLIDFSPASAAPKSTVSGCSRDRVTLVDDHYGPDATWNFNADRVAAKYGLYAAASADTYADNEDQYVFLHRDTVRRTEWQRLNLGFGDVIPHRFQDTLTGLSLDTYFKEGSDCVTVLVAIRGTDFTSIADWNTNLSWFSPLFPNQYRLIDKKFAQVMERAKILFEGRTVRYVATGHSLGGGLAIHLARCFDNTDAVTFDPSFVQNTLLCRNRPSTVIEIYEKNEVLANLRKFAFQPQSRNVNDERRATYGLNPIEKGHWKWIDQHSMTGMAAGLLRLAIECDVERSKSCDIPRSYFTEQNSSQYILYCDNFAPAAYKVTRALVGERDPVCSRWIAGH